MDCSDKFGMLRIFDIGIFRYYVVTYVDIIRHFAFVFARPNTPITDESVEEVWNETCDSET